MLRLRFVHVRFQTVDGYLLLQRMIVVDYLMGVNRPVARFVGDVIVFVASIYLIGLNVGE